jgi:hypothetical protein
MEMRPATQIEIGRAGPEEAVAIAGLLHESFVEFKALYTEAVSLPLFRTRTRLPRVS